MAISKKIQLVGLDIGSHSIKVVEIAHSKKARILKNFGVIGLPPDAIVEGSIKEMEVVSSAIKALFKNLKVKNKNVATSISGFSVIVKRIPLKKGEESELESRIQEEAEQYIPFDINEVNIDFDILTGETESAGGGGEEAEKEVSEQTEVMLVAAKKDMIEDHVQLLQLAGLNPQVLDVDAFALQNAFEISTSEPQASSSLVNVGAEELGINIIHNGASLFTRDSSYGGSQITKAIMSEFNVSFEEAEKMKLGGTKIDKEKEGLEEIFMSVVSNWVQEIKRALDFVANTYPDKTIGRILLSGGSSSIPGFQRYLELETDIPVEQLNPFTNLMIDEKLFDLQYLHYMAPQAAVAVGLALRSIGDK
ncbi:MAG: type IV pilus assembly protein PilM [Desulfobacteraceae bacterium]|nr:type IV pilus assembly protein PilM [Desulfobacteraceae bacterium]